MEKVSLKVNLKDKTILKKINLVEKKIDNVFKKKTADEQALGIYFLFCEYVGVDAESALEIKNMFENEYFSTKDLHEAMMLMIAFIRIAVQPVIMEQIEEKGWEWALKEYDKVSNKK